MSTPVGYVKQFYPSYRWHPTEPARLIADAEADAALDAAWVDTPAKLMVAHPDRAPIEMPEPLADPAPAPSPAAPAMVAAPARRRGRPPHAQRAADAT